MTTAAWDIREAIIERLSDLPGYKALPRRVPLPQLQPSDLPRLSVFIMGERLTPRGDAGASAPSFTCEITIGISDMRGFAATDVIDGQNDAAVDAIEERLLCDPSFTQKGPDALFEAVTGITRERRYPQDGETYFAELRLTMTFRVGFDYPPIVPDRFKDMAVTAKRPGHPGAPEPTIIIPVPQEETP
ncbi:hypothetical protein OMR07_05585 [Methylobacterium organophilum]|nr:hypothetical protein [Methylobacterium organophilum]